MKDIQPKKGVPIRKLYSKPVLVLMVVAIFLLARGTWDVFQKERESRKNAAFVMTELSTLKERKEVLQRDTDRLNTEEGVEEALREKFQVSKDGESVLVVVDKPLPPKNDDDGKSFFSKIWDSVSGIFQKDEESATSTDR